MGQHPAARAITDAQFGGSRKDSSSSPSNLILPRLANWAEMVNTFFIARNPETTASVLDDRRLGKQRVEAKQIIAVLEGSTSGWKNHPAAKAWHGHLEALKHYHNVMIAEWIKRGKNNTMPLYELEAEPEYPAWASCSRIHYSHRARLIQKDPAFYTGKFKVPAAYLKLGYIWPAKWTSEQLATLPLEELAEPYREEVHCTATKKNGAACANKALYGDKCGVHKDKDFVVALCRGSYKDGTACRFKAKENGFCGRHSK